MRSTSKDSRPEAEAAALESASDSELATSNAAGCWCGTGTAGA